MGLFQHYFQKNKGILLAVLVIIFYFAYGLPTNVGGDWHFWNHFKEQLTGIDALIGHFITIMLVVVAIGLLYIPYQTWKRTQE